MKRILLLLTLNVPLLILAQTGNIGINTTSPTNTLDVNGTARVRSMGIKTSMNYDEFVAVEGIDGVLNKTTKANIKKGISLDLGTSAAGLDDQSGSGIIYDAYLFDGSHNRDFVLPTPDGYSNTFYYATGEGNAATYTFVSTTGRLIAPSLSATPDGSNSAVPPYRRFPELGIEYILLSGVPETTTANWKLILTQPAGNDPAGGQLRFRYTKIEFANVDNYWFYIHRDPR